MAMLKTSKEYMVPLASCSVHLRVLVPLFVHMASLLAFWISSANGLYCTELNVFRFAGTLQFRIHPQKSSLPSPTSGGRSVCIVRSRTQATEFICETFTSFFWYLIFGYLVLKCPATGVPITFTSFDFERLLSKHPGFNIIRSINPLLSCIFAFSSPPPQKRGESTSEGCRIHSYPRFKFGLFFDKMAME
jgi:hypothetical protein